MSSVEKHISSEEKLSDEEAEDLSGLSTCSDSCENRTPEDFNYASAFAEFVERSTEYELAKAWFRDLDQDFRGSVRSALSIGAGTGHFDLDAVVPQLPQLQEYDIVENNADQIEGFKKNLACSGRGKAIKFNFAEQLFEDFEPQHKYDLVLIIHVLYYFPDQRSAIEKMIMQCLNPGGRIIIVHQTLTGIHDIQRHVGQQKNHYSSADIKTDFQALLLPYSEDILPSGIFVDDLPSCVIDFFLEAKASTAEEAKIRKYIEHISSLEIDAEGAKRLFMPHPNSIIQFSA